jgi:DNA repair exonuclease SbcCD ATPase subunit
MQKNNTIQKKQQTKNAEHKIEKKESFLFIDEDEIPYKILDTEHTKKISKIIHFADIHIPKDERHDEYIKVLDTFCEMVSKLDNLGSTLIVFVGDMIKEKNILTCVQIEIIRKFFVTLANYCDIVCIAGNHDIHSKEKDKNCVEILEHYKTKNTIHVLKYSGRYQYKNLLFGLTDMFSTKVTPPIPKSEFFQIGLYHGIINGSKIESHEFTNTRSNTRYFGVSEFAYYDCVMLGDVHVMQFLNKERTIAYCSSLIQQNFGEHPKDHGYIEWKIKNNKVNGTFVIVENDYAYVELFVENDELKEIDKNLIPKIPKFRISYKNSSMETIEKICLGLKKKYPNCTCEWRNLTEEQVDIKIGDDTKNNICISQINNMLAVNNIINDQINTLNLSQETKQSIQTMISNISENIKYTFASGTKQFKLNRLYFDNFLVYKGGNKINFKNLKSIVNLNNQNAEGKSSIVEALFYSLYGSVLRDCNIINLISIGEKDFKTEINFNINDVEYNLKRTRTVNGEKGTRECIELKENNKVISVDNTTINDKIEKILCSKDDFKNTITFQVNNNPFISLSTIEQIKILCRITKMDIFLKIIEEASSRKKDYEKELNDLESKNIKIKGKKDNRMMNLMEKLIFIEDELKNIYEYKNDIDVELIRIKKIIDKIKFDIITTEIIVKESKYIEKTEENNKLVVLIDNKKKNISERNIALNNLMIKKIELDNNIIKEKQSINKYKNVEQKHASFLESQKNVINIKTIQLEKIMKNMKEITKTNENLPQLEKNLKKYNDVLEQNNLQIANNNNKIHDLKTKIIKIIESKKVLENSKKYLYNKEMIETSENKKNNIMDELQNITNKLEQISSHKFNPNCKECLENPVTCYKIDYINQIKNLENKINIENEILLKLNKTKKNTENDHNEHVKNEEISLNNKTNEELINKLLEDNKTMEDKNTILKLNINNVLKEMDIYVKNKGNILHNNDLEEEIIKIKNEILHENNKKNIEYDEYIEHSKLLLYYENENEKNNLIIMKNESDLSNDQNIVNFKEAKLKENIELIEKHEHIENMIKNLEKDKHEQRELEYEQNKIEKLLKQIQKDLNALECEKILIGEKNSKFKEAYNNKIICENIIDMIGVGGIIKKYIKNVCTKLERNVNDILTSMAWFTVIIEYHSHTIYISINKNGKIIPVGGISSSERMLCDIAFRLSLCRLNTNLKSSFLILDEIFSTYSQQTLANIKPFFDYIKKIFDWVLVITHFETIKDYCDNEIKINVDDKGNSVVCI